MNQLMRNGFFTLILLYISYSASGQGHVPGAQGPTTIGRITGNIIDSKTKSPVEFASVALTREGNEKIINGTISDEKGFFKIENVTPGNYVVTINFIGYQKKVDSVQTTPGKPDAYLGKVNFEPSSTTLSEVVIEGEVPLIENKIDRLVYNAERDVTSQGGDATDILNKVPMVSVDMDGNIQVRGSSNVKILINGKPSGIMAASVADALKMLPADQIKSIEVITSPSSKYDAEGTAGIINIITKKKNMQGVTGSVSATAGNRRNNLGGNLSAKKGRFGINSSLNGNYNFPRKGFSTYYREDIFNDSKRTLEQSGEFIPFRGGSFANLSADYDINAYNTISSGIKVGRFEFNRENSVLVHLVDPMLDINQQYTRLSDNPNSTNSFDWNADYRKTFDSTLREFFISFLYTENLKKNDYTLLQSSETDYLNLNERSFNDGRNKEITLQADYVHPIKKATLETGVKSIFRRITSDYNYEVFNDLTGAFENSLSRSNDFDYHQNILAAYTQIGFKLGDKYEVKSGVRGELTNNTGNFSSGTAKLSDEYYNILPTVSLSHTFKKASNVRIQYSQRIQRPGLSYLNPFINASDPKNISFGNIALTPEFTHNIELTYGVFGMKTNASASVFYRTTNDVIQSYTEVDTLGISSTTFYNIGINDNVGVSLFGQVKIFKKITIRGSTTISYVEQKGNYKNVKLFNSGIQYSSHINTAYQIAEGFTAELFTMLNSPRVTLQGVNPSFSMTSLGVKKEILKKKGSIGANLYNPFYNNIEFRNETKGTNFYQKSLTTVPFRSFGVSFSYNFGKVDFKGPSQKKKKGINNEDIKKEGGEEF